MRWLSSHGSLGRGSMLLVTVHALVACFGLLGVSGAATVKTDLFGGLGDFEWGYTFRWASEGPYGGSDFDWESQTDEWHQANGYNWGYSRPKPDDAVASGWSKTTGPTVNPATNAVYRIVSSGLNSSNCQYFGLKGVASGEAYAYLTSVHLPVNDARSHDLHAGDRITLKFDYIGLSDYADLPSGSSVSYRLMLSWSGGDARKELPKVDAPQQEDCSVSCVVPSGATLVRAIVVIATKGDLGTHQPGISVDGAHLYVQRAGEAADATEEVPASTARRISGSRMFFSPTCDSDTYEAACNCDFIMMTEHFSDRIGRLRYYNPSIKILLYIPTNLIDPRYDATHEPVLNGSAVSFRDVLANHQSWLYPYSSYPYDGTDARSPAWRQLSYRFESQYPNTPIYYTHLSDPTYQSAWLQGVVDKVKKYKLDGVWIDTLVYAQWDMPMRECWELQSFVHGIMPGLRSAGLTATENGCAEHLDVTSGTDMFGLAGVVKFDPWWQPTADQVTGGYVANSPSTTTMGMQQEWAFFKPTVRNGVTRNSYADPGHWLRCLSDMDTVKRWNTATGEQALVDGDKKWLHLQSAGADLSDDPAKGTNGWLQFALCSYLLAQNNWTTFGCALWVYPDYRTYVDPDLGAAKALGAPTSEHVAYSGDDYCRYRTYGPSSDGGVGGVVVVNANPTASRSYVVGFDALDESGNTVPSGTAITLQPHTGRILLRKQSVSLSVDVPADQVAPGRTVTVTVTYRNLGVAEARDVKFQVSVPDQMTYVSGSAEQSGGQFSSATNTINWTITAVPAGGSGTKSFQATVR